MDDGWWDPYSYSRALVVTESDPEVRETLARIYGHEDLINEPGE